MLLTTLGFRKGSGKRCANLSQIARQICANFVLYFAILSQSISDNFLQIPLFQCPLLEIPDGWPGIGRGRSTVGKCTGPNGPNGRLDHFGQNDLIPNWILAFARPKWSILVHFGLKRSILLHLGPSTVLWPFLTKTPDPRNSSIDS